MVSSLRNRGTVFQELRYPKTGMAVQSGQDSSHAETCGVGKKLEAKKGRNAEKCVFCKCKFLKFADKNGEFCISVLEKVAGCPAGLPDAS